MIQNTPSPVRLGCLNPTEVSWDDFQKVLHVGKLNNVAELEHFSKDEWPEFLSAGKKKLIAIYCKHLIEVVASKIGPTSNNWIGNVVVVSLGNNHFFHMGPSGFELFSPLIKKKSNKKPHLHLKTASRVYVCCF